MVATTYNLPNHTSGDTFEGFMITVSVNETPLDLTDSDIVMQIRDSGSSKNIHKTYALGTGLTINDAAAGEFSFDTQIVKLPVKTYYYSIHITTSSDFSSTILNGTWDIVARV